MLICALTSGSAAAQDATPATGTPVPEPVACTAEPRDIDALLAFWFDPSGAPAATPVMNPPIADDAAIEGRRADDATELAITETTLSFVYCVEVAGQYARGLSFVTDDLLAQLGPDVTNPAQDSPAELRALLEGQLQGTPIAGEEPSARMPPMAGPRKVRVLEDGRVAAGWSWRGDKVLFIYEQVGDRWLIDEVIDIIEAAATPVP
jgi:hypothetical protein